MRRFVDEALPLGKEAASASLAAAGVAPEDVGLVTVVSCTGYATPGLDIRLARDLGMPASVQRVSVGHMGCYAAIPGLATVADAAVARGKVSLLLCVEVASLHLQPPCGDLEQVVAHALFSDAAAALTVVPEGHGLEVVDVVARTDTSTASYMTWDITDLGFRMGLSSHVGEVLQRHVAAVVGELLSGHGLHVGDVAHWAVHPGGPRIIDVVGDRLGLTDQELEPSRTALREHGNCSSASVLIVLDHIASVNRPQAGDYLVALAFGPGLTLYTALLRQR
jgi:alkylresorcinol/alkylpyrone synthase